MEIKVFSDVIDALGKVAKAVHSLTGFAKHERERQIAVVTETFTLLYIALRVGIASRGLRARLAAESHRFGYQKLNISEQ